MVISYLSPGLCEAWSTKGLGTYADQPFPKGSVLAVFGGEVLLPLRRQLD